jgi:hypothetical protein
MQKQLITFLLSSLFIISCTYFDNKALKESIQEVDTIVDYNTVDAFPLFPNCKDIPSREKQRICFQMEMAKHIYASLIAYQFNATDEVHDTVQVKLKIDAVGKTSLISIKISHKTKQLLPEFDSIVKVSLQNLPDLLPAIKRDMPVTTEFTLPIILKN